MTAKPIPVWVALGALALCLSAPRSPAQEKKPDPWGPVRFLVGEWEGSSDGQAGQGSVRRTYAFVLKERYLHEKNVSTYPPRESNRTGEVHEYWSFISHDRARASLVLRQFHQEGFINQYALNRNAAGAGTFALAAPGKEFEVYSRNTLKRVKRPTQGGAMADVTVKRFDDLERYTGQFQRGQQFLYAGRSLGVTAWGMNLLKLPPAWADYPEHDHAADGQEEVYVVLTGSATLKAGNEDWTIEPGMLARVGPAQKRKIVPGKDGVTLLVLGGTPGKAYVPRTG